MTRVVSLNTLNGGISRLRTKGGADPKSLYDLVDGFVSQAGTVESRPGTVSDAVLPAGTKGLCAFDGKLVVFSDSAKVVPAGYVCEILIHPTDDEATLVRIHFARPYLGYLYVVAEWSDDPTRAFHYWLQEAEAWQPLHVYGEFTTIHPTAPNGYGYVAERLGGPADPWEPNVERDIGDKVEPTVPNGFEYTVIEVYGDNPISGATEPTWPTIEGATVSEDTTGTPTPVAPPTTGPQQPPPDVGDRYGNPGGNRPGGGNPPTQAP